MKIGIIGGGSLGLLWATRIMSMEHELVLFTRTQEQQKKLNEHGLIALGSYENKRHYNKVRCECALYPGRELFDVVFVTVKQPHLLSLVPIIQSVTHPESQILFLQNGWGHDNVIRCLINRLWTYAMITTEGARRVSQNEVQKTGKGTTWIGLFPKGRSTFHPHMEKLMLSLKQLGAIEIYRDDWVIKRMWEKLLVNCAINPLTAIYGIRNGALLSPYYTKKMDRIICEAIRVSHRMGFSIREADLKRNIIEVCSNTRINFSSTAQDIHRGVPTEIDYLNGALVRCGEEVGIETPYNQELLSQVKTLEVGNGNKRNNTA